MKDPAKEIAVFADWVGLGGPQQLGTFHARPLRGKEVFSFEYDKAWLSRGMGRQLDPALRFFGSPQYPPESMPYFGLFLDSSPDRWGRLLMQRREAMLARQEGREARSLLESDFLLGVHDLARLGALRFKPEGVTGFASGDDRLAAPPWTALRDLEFAARKLEAGGSTEEFDRWLAILFAPGSSLGGARPKASVTFPNGELWIAKFPAKADLCDSGAWEMLAARLAESAGVMMSPCRLERFSPAGSTFLTRRFDREGPEARIHYASAMTLLGRRDGDDVEGGASYLEIAEFIVRNGSRPAEDLRQLWRRIVFSIAISNVDDHLRNHGFMLEKQGWRLSPAFDLNPAPGAAGLSLAINEHDNSLDLGLALEVAPYFRLSAKEAERISVEVVKAVGGWQEVARSLGISRDEAESMGAAFMPGV